MIPIKNLNKKELKNISSIAADGFKNNPGFKLWGNDAERRKRILTDFFFIAFEQLVPSNMVYATSENYEGICAFWTKGSSLSIRQKIKLVKLIRFFSFKQMKQIAEQSSQIKRAEDYAKNEDDYLFVFMVVVQDEYKHQGYMRQMMEFLLKESKKRDVICILETDSKRNQEIYEHFGMNTIDIQRISEDLTYYILQFK